MKPISLEDIRPLPAEFYLRTTDRTYPLRAVNLEDEVWIRQTFGTRIGEILQGTDITEMGRIVWRLMREEDRQLFPSVELQETDESGVTNRIRKGGVQLLIESIQGPAEKIVLHRALLQTIGISKPILDELTEEELKKNSPAATVTQSVGPESSISSHPNMDGPLITFGNSPLEKSQSHSEKSASAPVTSSRSRPRFTASRSHSNRKSQ